MSTQGNRALERSRRLVGAGAWLRSPATATGLVSGAAALALYLWSLAPGLTSADGGDFLIAAYHLGVPHPSGYPLWTMLGWLATRLPVVTGALRARGDAYARYYAAAVRSLTHESGVEVDPPVP